MRTLRKEAPPGRGRSEKMERPKIGPGYRVGKLEVLRPTGERKNG